MMQFLKRHYEKIILSAVLAGLGAAAFWLFEAVTEVKKQISTTSAALPAKPWAGADLTTLRNALNSLKDVPPFSLSSEHNLFNPVTWKISPDGRLFKQLKEGPSALAVTGIRPLLYTIRYDNQAGLGFYLIAKHAMGKEFRWFAEKGDKGPKTRPFPCVIVGTNDASQTPAKLQVLIPETGETNLVTATQPYQRVEGYETDMKYSGSDSTNVFTRMHAGDSLKLSGESYKIIAITTNAVTVQNIGTSKKDEREWNGGP